MPLPILAANMPQHYSLEELQLPNGRRYRARTAVWLGLVRHTIAQARDDAWEHFYQHSGAKPILRYAQGTYTDVLTGLWVAEEDVAQVRTFAEAFRMKAARFMHYADQSKHDKLHLMMKKAAQHHEDIAQRLEVQRCE